MVYKQLEDGSRSPKNKEVADKAYRSPMED